MQGGIKNQPQTVAAGRGGLAIVTDDETVSKQNHPSARGLVQRDVGTPHHDLLAVTETNAGGFIAVCECDWESNVHLAPRSRKTKVESPAKLAAVESHARHRRAALRAAG